MADHWVRELATDWPFGLAPYGQIGRHVKPLIAQHPFSQVQIHWKHFCQAAQREVASNPEKRIYWTPAKFAQFFTTWAGPTQSVVRVPYVSKYPTADEADAQAGIPIKPDIA